MFARCRTSNQRKIGMYSTLVKCTWLCLMNVCIMNVFDHLNSIIVESALAKQKLDTKKHGKYYTL